MCQAKMFNFPEQLSFDFERTEALPSYETGYNTGLNWDASWMPGGPWVYEGRNKEIHAHDKTKYDAWHEGFARGLKIRLENEYFAAWWNEFSRKPGHHRYYVPEVLTPDVHFC